MRLPRSALAAPLMAGLAGCKMDPMDPAGYIALQQRDLILLSVALMLLIIVPVIVATLFFAWRYRASNLAARYEPEWHHSTKLEMLIWGAPLAIILVLGAVTWVTTHTLDPYRPLDRLAANRPIPAGTKPLRVEVVALDWKWLFIYPDLGVATVNELAAPVDTPIAFKITASSVMNAFYIPAVAGQIYAMPGMQTQLHAVINRPGTYEGISSNYSGAGFSGMRFRVEGLSQGDFDRWVASARAAPPQLTRAGYLSLARPSSDEPVRRYGRVDPGLFQAIVGQCVEPGAMCMVGEGGMRRAEATMRGSRMCVSRATASPRAIATRSAAPQPAL